MSVISTIGGVAKIVLGGATLADGISDVRKNRKSKEEKDDFYDERRNDNEVIVEEEKED